MPQPIWLLPEVAQAVHKRQLAEHGGREGIRDAGLLEYALIPPQNLYAYTNGKSSLTELAAAYAYGLARNHPFIDGNKRTALVLSLLFLKLNHRPVVTSQEKLYTVFMALAQGQLSESELTDWFSTVVN